MDTAFALRLIFRIPQAYFIHTQENGLTGKTSDSIWRFLGSIHQKLERAVVRNAKSVVVFNESYTTVVKKWNSRAEFSPTWFDPELVQSPQTHHDPFKVIWVGRLETPKDPALAIEAFAELAARDLEKPWSLDMLGSGTLINEMREKVAGLPLGIRDRVNILGRVSPEDVGIHMAQAGVFLMTSHPGYEGYPRVLVESMASGLPAVVTIGSDTGGLVVEAINGFVRDRSVEQLAESISTASTLDRNAVRSAVTSHDAPTLVARILRTNTNLEKVVS
jgi:glycosyltransferase involved in cell wall biosynthesis